jgi:hypothetical protein
VVDAAAVISAEQPRRANEVANEVVANEVVANEVVANEVVTNEVANEVVTNEVVAANIKNKNNKRLIYIRNAGNTWRRKKTTKTKKWKPKKL